MTRLKNIQMILCISLTMKSFLVGDKSKIRNDKLDEDFLFFNLQTDNLVSGFVRYRQTSATEALYALA
jgi:hypothetical protein